MPEKHAGWTRVRVGRNRVLWVAYDDRGGGDGRQVVGQGYASSLREADIAAKEALASAGMYQARRISTTSKVTSRIGRAPGDRTSPLEILARKQTREYLYTRRMGDRGEPISIAAHWILRKTPRRIHVTQRSCGPDQLGTEDERWDENEPAIALDRLKLERDGSVYSCDHRFSDFYATREAAAVGLNRPSPSDYMMLGLQPPFSTDEIKAAYRHKVLEAHPDLGGDPAEFRAVETAYRRLMTEAGTFDL